LTIDGFLVTLKVELVGHSADPGKRQERIVKMRILCGLLSVLLSLYYLSFSKAVMGRLVVLLPPEPSERYWATLGKLPISLVWIPLIYGLYCIALGEFEYYWKLLSAKRGTDK